MSYPSLQYGTFLSNHDTDRVGSRLNSNVDKLKLAAALYLTLPGVPYLYYGEEIGMTGTKPDPNIRRPMQWTDGPNAGFTTGSPWSAVGSNFGTNNVDELEDDGSSLLEHYKRLIHLRNDHAPLRRGNYLPLTGGPNELLGFARVHQNEAVLVLSNVGSGSLEPTVSLPASTLFPGEYFLTDLYNESTLGTVQVDDTGALVDWTFPGTLEGRETAILKLTEERIVSTAEPVDWSNSVVVFPNPAHSNVQIRAPFGSRLEVFSTNGRRVFLQVGSSETTRLWVGDWVPGVYNLRMTLGGRSVWRRFVVQ